jgi:DNA-directed RNA polymerase subunit K/omega
MQVPREQVSVIQRPVGSNAFEFVIVSALRAAQLMRGCIPRVEGSHKLTTMAQMEVASGKVARLVEIPVPAATGEV